MLKIKVYTQGEDTRCDTSCNFLIIDKEGEYSCGKMKVELLRETGNINTPNNIINCGGKIIK